MDYLTAFLIAIFLISFIVGFKRGAVKTAFSLFATILTFVIVCNLSPYVSDAIIENTQTDEWIAGQIEAKLETEFKNQMAEELGLDDADEVDGADEMDKVDDESKNQLISNSNMPDFAKELLTENNNKDTFELLGVNRFIDYIGMYIAHFLIRGASYLLTLLFVRFILMLLMYVLNIAAHLPVLGLFNRLLGGGISLGITVILIWIFMTVLMLLATLGIGNDLLEGIQTQPFLQFLYQNNWIARMALGL